MRWALLVAMLAGCGEGGDGGSGGGGGLPTEQPPCEPPALTCAMPSERPATKRVVRECPDGVSIAYFEDGGAVTGWRTADVGVYCWPNNTVAAVAGEVDTVCWDEAGQPTACEPIMNGAWRDAWGF